MFNPANSAVVGGWSLVISIIGAMISIGGFWATISQLSRTNKSTQAVKFAVTHLQNRMHIYDVAVEAAKLHRIIEQSIMLLRPGLEMEAIPKLLEVQGGLHRLSIIEGVEAEDKQEFSMIASQLFDHVAMVEGSAEKGVFFDRNDLMLLLRKQMNRLDTVGIKAQKAAYNVA